MKVRAFSDGDVGRVAPAGLVEHIGIGRVGTLPRISRAPMLPAA